MKTCLHCHTENPSNANYCKYCGTKLVNYEPNTIYYEASEKIDRQWIAEESTCHDFTNGKGKIRLKDSVTKLRDYAFESCKIVTSMVLPDSLTEIGSYAFNECFDLEHILIPDSVAVIGQHAFEYCPKLKSIVLPKSLTKISPNTFHFSKRLKSVTVPDSVTEIDWYAFNDCESLSSINIPDSLTIIEDGAFLYCNNLPEETKEKIRKINERALEQLPHTQPSLVNCD